MQHRAFYFIKRTNANGKKIKILIISISFSIYPFHFIILFKLNKKVVDQMNYRLFQTEKDRQL